MHRAFASVRYTPQLPFWKARTLKLLWHLLSLDGSWLRRLSVGLAPLSWSRALLASSTGQGDLHEPLKHLRILSILVEDLASVSHSHRLCPQSLDFHDVQRLSHHGILHRFHDDRIQQLHSAVVC